MLSGKDTEQMVDEPQTEDGDEWFDAQEEHWFDCKEWSVPEQKSTTSPYEEAKETEEKKPKTKCVGYPIGYPCVLMLLPSIMWSMQSVGLVLKMMGLKWSEFRSAYFGLFATISAQWAALKLYVWASYKSKKNAGTGKKQVLMLALLIAMKMADTMPYMDLLTEKPLTAQLKKRRGKNGLLMTAKLTESELEFVREAVASLSGSLVQEGDSKMVIVDTGCTVTASGDKTDFEPCSLMKLKDSWALEGIGGALKATHKGIIRYEVVTDDGNIEVLRMEGYYMPDLKCRLFSPQAYALYRKEHLGDHDWTCTLNWAGSEFKFQDGNVVSIKNDDRLKLPIFRCFANATRTAESLALTCVTDERNQNLTSLQKKLLQWHFKLGHVGFQNLQWIGRQGWLGPIGEKMGSATVDAPKCAACQFGKQERTSKAGTTVKRDREGILKADKLEPGDLVFSDQFVSSLPGKVFGKRGASISSNSYSGGTLFCDAASKKIFVNCQVSLGAYETIESKLMFERDAQTIGVTVKAYCTDNGVYTSKEFMKELDASGQGIKHSGVGGHHHNGVAENGIKNVVRIARTLMIHAALRWPSMSDCALWPLALAHAVYLHNHTPDSDTKLSPEEIWCKTKSPHTDLARMHVWGCPAYVLDPRSQDGKKIPKWEPRSRRGQFVGVSPLHSSHVGLIKHLRTNNISPQFHVVYDDFFETVHAEDDQAPSSWPELLQFQTFRSEYDDEDFVPELSDEWVDESTLESRRRQRMERRGEATRPEMHESNPFPTQDSQADTTVPIIGDQMGVQANKELQVPSDSSPSKLPGSQRQTAGLADQIKTREQREDGLHCGTQERKPVDRYVANIAQNTPLVCKAICKKVWKHAVGGSDYKYLYALLMEPEFGLLENLYPQAISQVATMMKGTASDPDLPSLQEAMSGPHHTEFLEAMNKEIEELESHNTWKVIPKSSLPEGVNILPGTWALRIKRFPDGRFRKIKARFCARGDKQIEGIDYFDKYAPVVSWSTVRLLLCTSISQGWKTKQVDFSNAFVQAELEEDVYIGLPSGFEGPEGQDRKEVVLKLNKSLYGLVQAPMYWANHLATQMGKLVSKQVLLIPVSSMVEVWLF